MKRTSRYTASALVLMLLSVNAFAQDVKVMISGGFKAALEKLAPEYEHRTGDKIVVIPGPSMGNTPQAIPNRLARGEKADVVIMVGDALEKLEKASQTRPGSRTELADSPVGMVVKKERIYRTSAATRNCVKRCCRPAPSPTLTAPAAGTSARGCSKSWALKRRSPIKRQWSSAFRSPQKWQKENTPWVSSRLASCCRFRASPLSGKSLTMCNTSRASRVRSLVTLNTLTRGKRC